MKKKFILLGIDHPHYNSIISSVKERNDLEFTAVAQETAPFSDALATRLGIKSYRNYIEALNVEKPDIVGIAMYNGIRGKVINEVVSRQIAVITDKPLCLTSHELKQIRASVNATKVPLCMMLTCRNNPSYIAMKNAVSQGFIGDVLSVDAIRYYALNRKSRPDWMFNRKLYGGPAIDILTHDYDLARWITGIDWSDITLKESGSGYITDKDFSDRASLFSEDKSKLLTLKMFWNSPAGHWDRFTVLGTQGFLEISLCDKRVAFVNNKGEISYLSASTGIKPFATQFFDAFFDKNVGFPVTTADSLLVTERLVSANERMLNLEL